MNANKINLDFYFTNLWDSGRRCYNDLNSEETEILVGWLLLCNPMDSWEYITEADNKNEIPDLIARLLIRDTNEERVELQTEIKKIVGSCYKNTIQKMFEDKAYQVSYMEKYELQMMQHQANFPDARI